MANTEDVQVEAPLLEEQFDTVPRVFPRELPATSRRDVARRARQIGIVTSKHFNNVPKISHGNNFKPIDFRQLTGVLNTCHNATHAVTLRSNSNCQCTWYWLNRTI